MNTIEGVVTIVQESRFQVVDDGGVAHLFILCHRAAAEPAQLQEVPGRVRVHYRPAKDVIGNVAVAVYLVG